MRRVYGVISLTLVLLVLSACAASTDSRPPSPTFLATAEATASVTTAAPATTAATATAIATVTTCPLPGECPTWSPAAPASAGPITLATVDQLSAPVDLNNFSVYALSWSANGQRLALSSSTGIVVYAVDTWQLLFAIDMKGHPTFGLALSPDGKTLAYSPAHDPTKHVDNVVHLIDVDTSRERTALSGHEKTIWHIAFSADGAQLATNSDDYQIWIWDLQTEKALQKFSEQPAQADLAFSLDGESLLVTPTFGFPFVLDLKTGKVWTLGEESKGSEPIVCVAAFSPDGHTLLVGANDHQIHVWDVAKQQEVKAWAAHEDTVDGVAFAPDGQSFASSSRDGTIKLWNAATDKLITTLAPADPSSVEPVYNVMFSPDGRFLAARIGKDLILRAWGRQP
ncbi:MAG TPA: hypothetical protein VLG46_07450 [Anaerolineae bacterium]|nr:hypothetical protein [Anaerolineae bacterium]